MPDGDRLAPFLGLFGLLAGLFAGDGLVNLTYGSMTEGRGRISRRLAATDGSGALMTDGERVVRMLLPISGSSLLSYFSDGARLSNGF
jgi:hypothetical protein